MMTEELSIPTMGIGAGPHCDAQVLVTQDMLGMFDRFVPKFVKTVRPHEYRADGRRDQHVPSGNTGQYIPGTGTLLWHERGRIKNVYIRGCMRVRIAIIGAGAMGSLFGGKLVSAGHDVWLYDIWQDHVDKINRDGLGHRICGRRNYRSPSGNDGQRGNRQR